MHPAVEMAGDLSLLVEKCPSEELALTNRAVVNPADVSAGCKHVRLVCNSGRECHVSVALDPSMVR